MANGKNRRRKKKWKQTNTSHLISFSSLLNIFIPLWKWRTHWRTEVPWKTRIVDTLKISQFTIIFHLLFIHNFNFESKLTLLHTQFLAKCSHNSPTQKSKEKVKNLGQIKFFAETKVKSKTTNVFRLHLHFSNNRLDGILESHIRILFLV